ncbi:hypothetical protein BG015_002475 [Linnemannia schmuckeri]|uniref:Uncharacterized protein n=1 Tax=Linnemannia schmuckeri TaxID=64567 RepID=A0A9P5V6B0_9FUNG|nr:hypothetical protein BG015_002475 [Linnemannia schmuckeri]
MTTIRNSSKQTTSSFDSTTTTNADSPRQSTSSPEQTATHNPESSIDSTHQSSEATHEKSDQKLEATDPDMSTTTSDDSSTVDQVNDAVDTPINSEIQEEEPVSADNADAGGVGGSLAIQEEEASSDNKVHSIQLVDHIKGVSGQSKQVHNSDHGQYHEHDHDQGTTTSVPKDIESNTAETNRHGNVHSQYLSEDEEELQEVEELESTKHAKRMADDQARERHDYLAGAYKSPFRHTHKAEKVGREEL